MRAVAACPCSSPVAVTDEGRLHLLKLLKASPVASDSQPEVFLSFLASTFHSLQ